jgi:hypothetical protein
MNEERDAYLTTDQVLARLQARGLEVTRNMLGQDVKARYLPPLTMEPRGPRGIGRFWSPFAVERAIYLYRLRRQGVAGSLLRVLLFLRDGWGWEDVRPICVTGLRKVIQVQQSPIIRRLRSPTPGSVDFVIQDIVEDAAIHSEELARFLWGIGMFGSPLRGGSLQPLLDAFQTVYGTHVPYEACEEAERHIWSLGLTYERIVELVSTAEVEQAERARERFWETIAWLRRLQHSLLLAEGERGFSSNPLTLFGQSREAVQELCRSLPGRPTPAQLLGAWLALSLVELPGEEGRNIEERSRPT